MLALEFFTWWYGRGWRQLIKNMQRRISKTSSMFSVPILLRTLFSPWKRIITYPGSSLDAKLRAFSDNMVSRLVGFCVRLLVLFTAGIMLFIVGAVALIEIAVWPVLPLLVIVTLVKGITG
jgi:hypothetical protein